MIEYESKLEKELMERKEKLENANGDIGESCEQELISELWIVWDTEMRIYNKERKNYYKSKGSSGIKENMEKMMQVNKWKIIDMKAILINLLKEKEAMDRRRDENESNIVVEGNSLVKDKKSSESLMKKGLKHE